MVNYKDLGLVNTREMFAKAIKGGYAIPAFNFNNMEQMQAIIKAAVETKSPVILRYLRVPVSMPTLLCCVTWLRVLLSTLRNWVANILKLFFTSTTEIHSKLARAVSTLVSLQ